ncbi:TPA: nucleoside transporter [Escherichia coli]|nr:nucleoside transporter [Escherichia coli]
MKEGIYTVVFESNLQSVGEGIVVVSNGTIHGGDVAFTCRGYLRSPEIELEVRHYNEDIPSTLGIEGNYTLVMRYREDGKGRYHFSGYVKEEPARHLKAFALHLTSLLEQK